MSQDRQVRVLVATPLGEGGRGGIDRLMDEVRAELPDAEYRDLAVTFGVTRGQGSIALSPLYTARFIAQMAAAKLSGKVDVLHINLSSHGSTLRKIAIAASARKLGVPYVTHLHGSNFRQYWDGSSPGLSKAIHKMFAGAALNIVLGSVWRDFIVSRVPEARMAIVPNATRRPKLAHTGSGGDKVQILFLGRVGPRKGVPQLVDALKSMAGNAKWTAVIAGDGDVEAMKQALAGTPIADRVRITGWVGPQDVAQLLATSEILVLPSFDENLPMSVIEGMASGLGVVATPVGATEDIVIHEETGLLVPPGDVPALAAALEKLVNDDSLRVKLGQKAQALHDERLEISAYTRRLSELWRGVAIGV